MRFFFLLRLLVQQTGVSIEAIEDVRNVINDKVFLIRSVIISNLNVFIWFVRC